MIVHCWDCPTTFEIPGDMEGHAYTTGRIRRRVEGDNDSRWMGLCERCTVVHARADEPGAMIEFRRSRGRGLDDLAVISGETHQILLRARELCENDLDLPLDQAIHQAVDALFAPNREPNQAFREYLLRRTNSAA